ncbi:MAG: EAL domain-containing protein [Nevskia sp.]|nr:EAL domain-containing protein [Nevskia sp.]
MLAGWLLRIPVLTSVLPGLTSMVFDTALCFVLCGLALWLNVGSARQRRLVWLPAAAVLIIALLSMVFLNFGIASGIEWADLHRWNPDGNPHPGQMSLATTISWLLAAPALLLLQWRTRQQWPDLLLRVLSVAVFAIGLSAVIGYLLRIELLYSWYAFSRLALLTAIGMTLLATALWLSRVVVTNTLMQERQLQAVGVFALIVVGLVSGLTGIAVFRLEGETALGKSLSVGRDGRTELLATMLQLRATRASIVNTRPELIRLLRQLADAPNDRPARQHAQDIIESFMPYGFSSIEVLTAQGHSIAASGTSSTGASLSVPVATGVPGNHLLLWRDGFLLRSSYAVSDGDGPIGALITEQPLPSLYRTLTSAEDLGSSAEIMLCSGAAAAPLCFPNRSHAEPFTPDADEAAMLGLLGSAARGISGSDTVRAGNTSYLTAYGPVAATGLFSVVRVDASELYAPIRRGLFWGFLLVGILIFFAALLLRALIRPLVRQLAVAEGYNHTVLEALSEGIMLFDSRGTVLAVNAAAEQQFGAGRAALMGRSLRDDWQIRHEDGSHWPFADYPAFEVLRTGRAQYGIVMDVLRADGERRWVSFGCSPTGVLPGRSDHGVVVTATDITEQRRAAQESALSEARYQTLVGGIADGVVSIDAQGIVHSFNLAAEKIFGRAADQVLGRNVVLLMPERFRAHHDQNVARFALQQDPKIIGMRRDVTGLRADGSEFPMMLALNVVPGTGPARFVALVTDISQRKQDERCLAEAYSFQRAMLDAAPYAIIASGTDMKCTVFNAAAERMLWYTEEEMLGRIVPELIHDPRETASRAAELSLELGRTVAPGVEVFVNKSRLGISEEHEWTYIRKDGSRFPVNLAVTEMRDDAGQATGYLGIAYDITERKRREDYTQHVAHHDFLTGLPNRMLLHDRLAMALEGAKRAGQKVAVLLLDLDHFKRVNDSLGHHIGDELLKAVAERIQACVRSVDTVARMGGDEFVIVLGQISNVFDVERIATNIVDKISAPMKFGAHELVVSPSIGISCYPDDGEDGNHLLKNADSAMYRAKDAGRRGYCLFNSEMSRQAQQKLELENAIHRALRDDGFELHYQPQICLQSGAVLGMEALLRWDDPVLGKINPDQFIPVAESSGLIVPLGEWVLRTACREARALQQRTGHALKVAVNLSARQFRHPALATQIGEALSSSGLSADSLEVEITEGMLMSQTEETLARLHEIRALGVTIAIDDFGIGFSSLSYITRFPIDTLKIDRCFVRNLPDSVNDAAVAQAIIALATSLRIKVVAEGVETREQLDFLRLRSCDAAQGFYLGEPVPAGNFSVQGFCFSKALSVDDFVAGFEDLQKLGARSVVDQLH